MANSGKAESKLSHFSLTQENYETLALHKTQTFHNSRGIDEKSRLAGSNQNSGIYYYESINKDAVFYTELKVESEYKGVLLELIKDGELRLGKSKNNQFGRTSIEVIDKLQKNQTLEGDRFDVTFISPTILVDKKGYTNLSQSVLSEALEVNENKITNTNIRKEVIQRFQGNLNVLLGANEAITPGSSFRLEGVTEEEILKLKQKQEIGVGLETEKGFGRFKIETVLENLKLTEAEPKGIELNDFKIENINSEIATKIRFELEKKEAKQIGFEKAGRKGGKNEYKNAVYQALNWLASCKGSIDNDKWEGFKRHASKKVQEKFIKRHDLTKVYNKSNLRENELKYIAALAYVERLKSNLN